MNTMEQASENREPSVEDFRKMSPNQLRDLERARLEAKGVSGEYTPADIDMIIAISARLLNSEMPDTVSNVFDLAEEIRLDARKALGSFSGGTYAKDVEGKVVAAGSNEVEAMKKAQAERAE